MKRNLKRLTCLVLSLVMVLGMLPVRAQADGIGGGAIGLPGGSAVAGKHKWGYNNSCDTFMRFTLVKFPNSITNKEFEVISAVDIYDTCGLSTSPASLLDVYGLDCVGTLRTNAMGYAKAPNPATYVTSAWNGSLVANAAAKFAQIKSTDFVNDIKAATGVSYKDSIFHFGNEKANWGSDFPGYSNGTGKNQIMTLFGTASNSSVASTDGYNSKPLFTYLATMLFYLGEHGNVSGLNSDYAKNTKAYASKGNGFFSLNGDGKSMYRIFMEPGFIIGSNRQFCALTVRDMSALREAGVTMSSQVIDCSSPFKSAYNAVMLDHTELYGRNADGTTYNNSPYKFYKASAITSEDGAIGNSYATLFTNTYKQGGGLMIITPDDFVEMPQNQKVTVSFDITKTVTSKGAPLSDTTKAYVYPFMATIDVSGVTKVDAYKNATFDKSSVKVTIRKSSGEAVEVDPANVVSVSEGGGKQVRIYFGLKDGESATVSYTIDNLPMGTTTKDIANKTYYAVQEYASREKNDDLTWGVKTYVTGTNGTHPDSTGKSVAKLGDMYQYGMATSIAVTGADVASRVDENVLSYTKLRASYEDGDFDNCKMDLGKFYHVEKDTYNNYQNASVVGRLGENTKIAFTNQWHTPRVLELSWDITKDASSIIASYPGAAYVANYFYPFFVGMDATEMAGVIDRDKIKDLGATITDASNGKWLGQTYGWSSSESDKTRFDPLRVERYGHCAIQDDKTARVTWTIEISDTKLADVLSLPAKVHFTATELYPWTDNALAELHTSNNDWTNYISGGRKGMLIKLYVGIFGNSGSADNPGSAYVKDNVKQYWQDLLDNKPLPDVGVLEDAIKTTMFPTPSVYAKDGGIVTNVVTSDSSVYRIVRTKGDKLIYHLGDIMNTDHSTDPATVSNLSHVKELVKFTGTDPKFTGWNETVYYGGNKAGLDAATGKIKTTDVKSATFINSIPGSLNGRTSFAIKKANKGFATQANDGEDGLDKQLEDAWYGVYIIADTRAFIQAVLTDPDVQGKGVSVQDIGFSASCSNSDNTYASGFLRSGRYSFPTYIDPELPDNIDPFKFGGTLIKAGDELKIDVSWMFDPGSMDMDALRGVVDRHVDKIAIFTAEANKWYYNSLDDISDWASEFWLGLTPGGLQDIAGLNDVELPRISGSIWSDAGFAEMKEAIKNDPDVLGKIVNGSERLLPPSAMSRVTFNTDAEVVGYRVELGPNEMIKSDRDADGNYVIGNGIAEYTGSKYLDDQDNLIFQPDAMPGVTVRAKGADETAHIEIVNDYGYRLRKVCTYLDAEDVGAGHEFEFRVRNIVDRQHWMPQPDDMAVSYVIQASTGDFQNTGKVQTTTLGGLKNTTLKIKSGECIRFLIDCDAYDILIDETDPVAQAAGRNMIAVANGGVSGDANLGLADNGYESVIRSDMYGAEHIFLGVAGHKDAVVYNDQDCQYVDVQLDLTKKVSGQNAIKVDGIADDYATSKAVYPFYISFDYSKIQAISPPASYSSGSIFTAPVEFYSVNVQGVDGSWYVTEGNTAEKQAYAWVGLKAGQTAKVTLKLRVNSEAALSDATLAAMRDLVVYGIEECTQWSGTPGLTVANLDYIRFMPENARKL